LISSMSSLVSMEQRMPAKAADRIKAMRERAAALAPQPSPPEADEAPAPTTDHAITAVSAHFGAALDPLVRNRAVQSLPIGHIAPDTRPEMRQPRLLPPPEELLEHGQPVPAYRELVAELLTLGQSLKERQIQPIVVYPGTSAAYPAVRYLILVGQRRWTAAHLVDIDTLDAIVVDPPSPADRVRIQYAENEDREEFSDMERAWALLQMKQAMSEAPWEEVETRLQMSRARRQQLLRLTSFTPTQQQQVARLRLHETQIRSLHSGVRNEELTPAQVDAILYRLSQIASERAAALATAAENAPGGPPPRRAGIDGLTIARLVARAQRTGSPLAPVTATPTPRWLPPLHEQLVRANQGVQRAIGRVDALGPADTETLLSDIGTLLTNLTSLMAQIQGESDTGDQKPSRERVIPG
jgi:ParB/RepB/Spo0J family partition protein